MTAGRVLYDLFEAAAAVERDERADSDMPVLERQKRLPTVDVDHGGWAVPTLEELWVVEVRWARDCKQPDQIMLAERFGVWSADLIAQVRLSDQAAFGWRAVNRFAGRSGYDGYDFVVADLDSGPRLRQ